MYVRLAITLTGRALFDSGFELSNHVQMKNSGYGGVIGRAVMHFKLSALVRGSGGNSQVSLSQLNLREIFDEPPVLREYALGKPKLTVGTFVVLQVFDSGLAWTQVYVKFVVYSLARIFDLHTKIRDIILSVIFYR